MGNKKKDALALNDLTQENIPELLQKVNDRIAAFSKDIPDETRITKNVPGFDKAIDDIDSVEELISAHASIRIREVHYNDSANLIIPKEIKKPPYKLDGHSAKQWMEQIQNRVSEVNNKESLDTLKKIKDELEKNLSEKDKLANSLGKIQGLLTDLTG